MLGNTPHKLNLENGIFDLTIKKKEIIKAPEGVDISTISPNIISLDDI